MKFFERWIRRQVDYAAHSARQVFQDTRFAHSVIVVPPAPSLPAEVFGVTVLGQTIEKVKRDDEPPFSDDPGFPLVSRNEKTEWVDAKRMGAVGAWGAPDGAGKVKLIVQTNRPMRLVQVLTYGPADWFLTGWWRGSDYLFDSVPCAVAWNNAFFDAIELWDRDLRLLPGEQLRFELSQVRQ